MPYIPKKQQRRPWIIKKPFENRKEDNMTFYNSKRWRTLRKMFLAQNPLCVHCLAAGITKAADHVDHIVEINKGGAALDWNNLQPLCLSCHAKKTASK